MDAPSSSDRPALLLPRLQTLFAEMSGMDVADLTPTTSFLELGFDSLFLTQVSTTIKKSFGVTVSFRELFEDLSTLALLAARLAEILPPQTQVDSGDEPGQMAQPMRARQAAAGGTGDEVDTAVPHTSRAGCAAQEHAGTPPG